MDCSPSTRPSTIDRNQNFSDVHLDAARLCEQKLGYKFKNPAYLCEAITHASIADTRLVSYERLEFLGDSILGFVVCEYLFHTFPDWLEGELTKVKSNVVSRRTCGLMGEELELEECLVVGKGVGTKGKVPRSLLANAFESVVAAIYMDGGWDAVKDFLIPMIERHAQSAVDGGLEINYKSELQQYAQKRYGLPPRYILVADDGPDHDKSFKVAAVIGKREFGPAWGKNKKQAEQHAAANALAKINGDDEPFI